MEYTTSEGGGKKAESPDEFDDEGDVDAVIFDDYSKIIEELQSHRREIEKLQTDFASSNTLCQKDDEVDEDDFLGPRTVKGGGFFTSSLLFFISFSVSAFSFLGVTIYQ